MIQVLYTLCIYFYKGATSIASFFNSKAKKRIEGISKSRQALQDFLQLNKNDLVFIHCASQGEHEQAKPLIRWILKNCNSSIVLSFFSPSGYENADYQNTTRLQKIYLPFDTPSDMSKLMAKILPKVVIIIKNEWWWNMIHTVHRLKIPMYLVSATIRKHHYFLKYPFQFFMLGLRSFTRIFVIDKSSQNHISKVSPANVMLIQDTRIDQVNYIRENLKSNLHSNKELESNDVIVYGSIWEHDLNSVQVLIDHFPNHIHLIYPHELNDVNIRKIQSILKNGKIIQSTIDATTGINIISSMGELKYAYQLADVAYVGGGFGVGIHNILEAAVYNIPTIFGPNYKKSNEARFLLDQRAVFTFVNNAELKNLCAEIDKESIRKEIESKLKAYFSPDISSAEIICREIFKKSELNVR